jgi:hypothetical protein
MYIKKLVNQKNNDINMEHYKTLDKLTITDLMELLKWIDNNEYTHILNDNKDIPTWKKKINEEIKRRLVNYIFAE